MAQTPEPGGVGGAIWSGGPANPSAIAGALFRGNATGTGTPEGAFGRSSSAARAAATAARSRSTPAPPRSRRPPSAGTGPKDGNGGAAALTGAGGSLRIAWSTLAGNARGALATGGNAVQGGQVSASILATPGSDLVANGGGTPTMLPGPGSAAVNALVGVPCPGTDQRGLPRRRPLGACDAGAVEVQPSEPGAAGVAQPTPGAATRARRVSSLSLSPSVFRAARSGASVGALTKSLQARAPIGATVRYRLDGAARVTFTITMPVPGRQALRQAGRRQPGRQALHPHPAARGQLPPPGRRLPERLPLHRPPARQGRAAGPLHAGRQAAAAGDGKDALATRAFRIVRRRRAGAC